MGRYLVPLAVVCAVSSVAQAADLVVTVTVEGIETEDLAGEMRRVSALARAEEGAFSSLGAVRRTAQSDTEAIRQALVSKGYYAATVDPRVERADDQVDVTFTIVTGPPFEVTEYRIDYSDQPTGRGVEDHPRPTTLRDAGLRPRGEPTGEALQGLENGLLGDLFAEGYPGAESLGRRVEADFAAGAAVAVFPMRSGPLARYGQVVVRGAADVDETYVRQLRTFEAGEVYKRSEIDEYREALAETGLFREIDVQPAPPGYDGSTDVLVEVAERPRRTLTGGLSFDTSVGPGVTAGWENRNLLGRGERLAVGLALSAPLQELQFGFVKPRPRLPGSYNLTALFRNETTDAFTAQTGEITGSVTKYWFERDLETIGGLRYQYADITDQDGIDTTFSSVSVPLAALWNNETDELNPVDGWRGRFTVEPFFGDVGFVKTAVGGASRVGFGDDDKFLIAGRVLVGSAYGTDRDAIPSTERYFAGGGGSVRGYGYLEAGPLNIRDDGADVVARIDGQPLFDPVTGEQNFDVGPIGGASLFEANLEARYRVTDTIQAAVFVDGGSVFEANTPDFQDIFVGAGVGVRYFTPIGPIRLDVALPLNRRVIEGDRVVERDGETVIERQTVFEDDLFGVYIALGQPF